MATLINDFMSLIYPPLCAGCNEVLLRHEKHICHKCLVSLPYFNYDQSNKLIITALGGRVPLVNAAALFHLETGGKVQQILHALKYDGEKEIGDRLGEQFFEAFQNDDFFFSIDAIIPVPLHAEKFKSRGYNQSAHFGKGISKTSGIPVISDILLKSGHNETQTRKKKYERWENVANVYTVTNPGLLKNKHILLVDDVITTGATIEGVWQALSEIEGIRFSVACIAYTI